MKREVNALEYEALISLDKMVRLAMSVPSAGEFLVSAIHALDAVRINEGLEIPEAVLPTFDGDQPSGVSDLAASLIKRAMQT